MIRADGIVFLTAAAGRCGGGCGAPALAPNEMHADLDFLFEKIEQVHPKPYAYVSRSRFADLRKALYERIDRPMTAPEFYWLVAPAVASLRSSHTLLHPPEAQFKTYQQLGGAVYPLAVRFADRQVILADALGPPGLPIGGQILTINGRDAGEFLARLAKRLPDERRSAAPTMLQRPRTLQLLLWLACGGRQPLQLRVRDAAGPDLPRRGSIGIADHALPPLYAHQVRRRLEARNYKWQWFPYTRRFVEDANAAVVTIDSFTDPHWYTLFLADTFRELREKNTADLIIDLRRNRGGSVLLAEVLLALLTDRPFRLYKKVTCKGPGGGPVTLDPPEVRPGRGSRQFSGRVYVLIGRGTASASVAFAAAVKHYGLGVLVGQETGGRNAVYGSPRRFRLPHSGLRLSVASNHAVVVGPDAPDRGVRPHHEVRQTSQDSARAIDTVLEFTLDLIRRQSWKKPHTAR